MDHTENLQYGLHSTLWVLGKDVTPNEVCTTSHPGMKGVHTASHYRIDRQTKRMQLWLSSVNGSPSRDDFEQVDDEASCSVANM